MNHLLEKLFEEVRVGSVNEQNDAISKFVEILRKNYQHDMESYAYIFLKSSEPLFILTLTDKDKTEIIDELEKLIVSEPSPSSRRASLLWALGSAYEWKSIEFLVKFLRDFNRGMSGEEFYQALISFDNLLTLGRENKPKLLSLLKTYNVRQIVSHHTVHKRIGLAELAASILRQLDQLELEP